MRSIIFATNNKNKLDEIRAILNNGFEIISLQDAGINIEIPEPYDTLAENAREKSTTINRLTGKDCFGEDTGLFTDALHGDPGVKSARYAGNESDFKKNIKKLLDNLKEKTNREAAFMTVISLIIDEKEYRFEGICRGRIVEKETGSNGFGYDSIFIPDGSIKTFAEMSMEEKNKFSHRKKATMLLAKFLNNKYGED